MGSAREALGRLWSAVAWMVVLGAAAVLLAAVVVPRVTGATPYTVLTGSMQPDLSPGSLVVVRPVPVDEIGVGSVITYQQESGEALVVTHRVVAVRMGADGEPAFRTQGDANEAPDVDWVRPVQIRGEVWYDAPYLGHVSQLLSGRERRAAVYLAAGALLLYAGAMFASALRGGRGRRSAPPNAPAGRHLARAADPEQVAA